MAYVEIKTNTHFLLQIEGTKIWIATADNNMFFWLIFLYLNSFEIWSKVR